jgi:two-component system CheB/CheR fusion protein
VGFPVVVAGQETKRPVEPAVPPAPPPPARLLAAAQQLLLERYAPACVIINRRYEILHFSGPTDDFLAQPAGAPTHDLMSLTREGLHSRLRGAIHKASRANRPVVVNDLRLRRGRSFQRVRFAVEPLRGARDTEGLLLISFFEHDKATAARTPPQSVSAEALAEESQLQQMESELRATREDLQSTIEELETSNEELKAANEEMMSVNEELQSTNEELETSKEELQSLNEELSTVNNQLENKVGELEAANNDLNNLLVSTDLATLFLDTHFRIRRFTPAMTQLLRLIPSDVGRPVSDLASPIVSPDLLRAAQVVLDALRPSETEVQASDGRWYLRRILPYRTEDNRIDGVVVTFHDMTLRKQTEEQIRRLNEQLRQRVTERTADVDAAHQRLAAIVTNVDTGLITIDEHGIIETFNPAAERIFGYAAAEVVGGPVTRLMPSPYAEQHDTYVSNYLKTGKAKIIGIGREVVGRRKDGSVFPMDLRVAELHDRAERAFIGSVRDLTERKRIESERSDLEIALARLADEERRKIGMELHDPIGQVLAGTAMLARSLEQRLRQGGCSDADSAAEIVGHMRSAYAQVRNLARGLAPATVADMDLNRALADLTEQTRSAHDIACDFTGDDSATMDSIDECNHVYWIAHEAVSNAVRHARARRIRISLRRDSNGITLSVSDDGIGPPSDEQIARGVGLRIMQTRAQLIGAGVEIRAAEGGGTLVRCVLPREPD